MSRPVIGVTGPRGRGLPMWAFAALALLLRGARPVRITAPFDPSMFDGLDGLLIGGGDDIGATLYGGVPEPNVRIDLERDELELTALEKLWSRQIPIMGICRGAQMLNIFMGGSLHQNIYDVYVAAPRLRTPLPRKTVTLSPKSQLAGIVGAETVIVNALHHQSVDRLGDGFSVAARDEHGIVQAIEHGGPEFRVGVQWHPEFLFYRPAHWRLFGALVHAARAYKASRTEVEAAAQSACVPADAPPRAWACGPQAASSPGGSLSRRPAGSSSEWDFRTFAPSACSIR